ncbi:rhodanese family protein [Neisseria shayeganii]|uniref:DUF2892 domain-containing protein n=1 Tax=Neisseria shayeganii TaxID=607712 RepID=A0A7D7NAV8_9NEIS|nr:rhodanese family protein [Neisseria shayeganii]QMT39858.1 DUF2892 domain-containing protein [Neisseria shayeganii]
MALSALTPQQAAEKLKDGAVLVDIRSSGEYAHRHIDGALSLPLDQLSHQALPAGRTVIFSCLSGMRTRQNAATLAQCAGDCPEVYILEGGLNAWAKAGLPVQVKPGQPLDIMRQVQIAAGSLVLLGAVLGFAVSPWFYALCAFVGAGLLFAGLTGFCGMAKLLACMPWNRA